MAVAVVALVAFSAAAGSLAGPDLRGEETPVGRDVEEDADPTSVLPPATEERCLFCGGGGVNGLVAAYVPALGNRELVLLAAAGVAVLGALWHRAGGSEPPADAGEPRRTRPAVETAAGTIAPAPDPFDDPPADNAVYRAWNRLVELVEPSRPPGWTPGEYAARARERGLDGEAVDALTRLFREVRYGEAAPTDERERRAEAAAERIDRTDGESTTTRDVADPESTTRTVGTGGAVGDGPDDPAEPRRRSR